MLVRPISLWTLLAGRSRTKTRRTFVVLGCPRGGTSLVAGALSAAGVRMGQDNTHVERYEDPEFRVRPTQASEALERLRPVIERRNRTCEFWGWKAPNNIYYIESIRHLLINPAWLFIYRNTEDIARSSARHEGRDWMQEREKLLRIAERHTQRVRNFERSLHGNVHVFQLEEIHANPGHFADRIADVVSPIAADTNRIRRFVDPEGGYHLHEDL